MSTFTLAISCLPWFMDPTFQVPMHYCSLQHRTWLLSPVTSTTGCCFCFGSISSFFLMLFLHWSPVAYWAPTDLGSSSFSVLSLCLFLLFMGSQSKNTEVVCHSLLQWTTFASVIVVFSLPAIWWRIRGLWKLPNGIDWLRGKLGLVLMGGAVLSKSLTQFSVDG